MRASWCRPGSPAGPSTSPVEPRPSETCATLPGAAAAAQSTASASSLVLTAWWSWQLASLNFKPAFDPGCRRRERPPAHPPASSWLEPRWHQQPDSIHTLSKQHIHTPPTTPPSIQTTYPHTINHTTKYPNSISAHHQPHHRLSSSDKVVTIIPDCPTSVQIYLYPEQVCLHVHWYGGFWVVSTM